MDLQQFMDIGEKLKLEGKELLSFVERELEKLRVKEEAIAVRKERAAERQARKTQRKLSVKPRKTQLSVKPRKTKLSVKPRKTQLSVKPRKTQRRPSVRLRPLTVVCSMKRTWLYYIWRKIEPGLSLVMFLLES